MTAAVWILGVLLCLSLAANVWLVVRVVQPLRRLSARAVRLAQGDFQTLERPCGGVAEIDVLRRSIVGMVGHVRRAQEQGSAYAGALTRGQESERQRIARELHDDSVQAFVAIGQSIDLAINWLQNDPERARETLAAARGQVGEAVTSLRNLIADLRPPALEELGLVAALETLADRLPRLKLTVEVEGTERRLDEMRELTLFRSAQEGLANAQRHGYASQATIRVIYQPEGTRLIVRDNGNGFRPPERLSELAEQGHYGLRGIQERVQQFEGTLRVKSDLGLGTTLDIFLPSAGSQQPSDTVRDPVCSALIHPSQAYGSVIHNGQRYYFCCPVCMGAFQREPETYLIGSGEPEAMTL